MKTWILYSSHTGFTERYARWIAEAMGGEALTLREARGRDLSTCDALVYGGWCLAGTIKGVKSFFRLLKDAHVPRLAVFCVGLADPGDETIRALPGKAFTPGQREKLQFYYFRGGLDPARLRGLYRWMMLMVLHFVKKKKEPTEDDRRMLQAWQTPVDMTDRAAIEPLLAYLREGSPASG